MQILADDMYYISKSIAYRVFYIHSFHIKEWNQVLFEQIYGK